MLGFSAVGETAVAAAAPAVYTFSEPFESGASPWSFDTFNGTAGVLTLDTSNQLHGTGCLDVNTTLNAGRLRINAAHLPLSGKLFVKFYLYVVAAPSGTSILFKHSGPSGANLMQIGYGTGLGLALRDNAGAFASSHTLTTGSWYRVEAMHDMDASKIQMRVWNSPESTAAADYDTGLVASTGTPDLLTLGQDSSVTSHHRIDSFQLSTVDWIGPDPSAGTTAPASEAAATAAAFDATIKITPNAAEATATGSADNPTVVTGSTPTEAAATGAANDATTNIAPAPAQAAATATANDATVLVTPVATEATGTGTANDGIAKVTAVDTGATGTGGAFDASVAIVVPATEATGTGTANDATVSTATNTTATATEATGTGQAFDATALVAPAPVGATGTGLANDATAKVLVNADPALGTGLAPDGFVDSTSVIAGGNTGNNASPSVTFPATIQAGQVITLMLMLNNTDNITATPAALTTLDAQNQSGSGQGTSVLYRLVADGTTAGSTLSWTLAATRNWAIAYVSITDADQDPVHPYDDFNPGFYFGAATANFTPGAVTSTQPGYVFEFVGVKGNGIAIANIAAPANYSRRTQIINGATFGSNIAIGLRDGIPNPAGSYGGDTWVADQTTTLGFLYTIVIPKAPGISAATGDGVAFDATVSVTAAPVEASGSGSAAWDSGDTVDTVLIADNPIYATGTAFDATVITGSFTTATPTEAAGSGQAFDPTVLIVAASGVATGAGVAFDAAALLTVFPDTALGSGTAHSVSLGQIVYVRLVATPTAPGFYQPARARDRRRRNTPFVGLWPRIQPASVEKGILLWQDGRVKAVSSWDDYALYHDADDRIAGGYEWVGRSDSWQAQVLANAGYTLEVVSVTT